MCAWIIASWMFISNCIPQFALLLQWCFTKKGEEVMLWIITFLWPEVATGSWQKCGLSIFWNSNHWPKDKSHFIGNTPQRPSNVSLLRHKTVLNPRSRQVFLFHHCSLETVVFGWGIKWRIPLSVLCVLVLHYYQHETTRTNARFNIQCYWRWATCWGKTHGTCKTMKLHVY